MKRLRPLSRTTGSAFRGSTFARLNLDCRDKFGQFADAPGTHPPGPAALAHSAPYGEPVRGKRRQRLDFWCAERSGQCQPDSSRPELETDALQHARLDPIEKRGPVLDG